MANILIVDDDAHNIRLLQKILVHERYTVSLATNGVEALEAVGREVPDLILLDVMMPGLDGFQVTQRLRAEERYKNLPIIVVSAKVQTRDITYGLDAGANDYITKPINVDELLARVRTQLRLKEAQDKLTRANEELLRLSELKGRLVAVVSHELRTPLTSIRSALELVIKRAADAGGGTLTQLLEISIRNTDRLIRLVNDVLDFARLEQGGPHFQLKPFALGGLVSRAVDEVTALGEPHQIRVRIEISDDLPMALGDIDRLHQVVINLLSNAIKFSPTGSDVVISALECEAGLRVLVRDQGRGIAAADLPRLFQPFQQVGLPVHKLGGGTGLGLVISREIVERHGGHLEVESTPGEGSTFAFTLAMSPSTR